MGFDLSGITDIFTGGGQVTDAGNTAASWAQYQPWNISTPFGSSTYDTNTNTASYSASPEYEGLLQGYTDYAGSLVNQDGVFASNQESATNDLYGLLSDMAAPGEQQAWNSFENDLYSRGMLGSTGGAEQTGQFQDSLNRADMDRQLQAYGLATDAANSEAARVESGINMGNTMNNASLNTINTGANMGSMDAMAGASAGGFLTGAADTNATNTSALWGSLFDATGSATKLW